jgi:hypothetical protein
MFGYVLPLKSELKVREFEVYHAYYCAVCRAIKRRYGELPRLLLSYDSAFMALLAGALAADEGGFSEFRCFTNPAKRRNEAQPSPGIDYAADALVLLAYLSIEDDVRDDGGVKARGAKLLFGSPGRRAADRLGGLAASIMDSLAELTELERQRTDSIDRIADPFGRLMAATLEPIAAFTGEADGGLTSTVDEPLTQAFTGEGDDGEGSEAAVKVALAELGYHMGRYIYTVDAIDDFARDVEENKYNPFIIISGVSDAEEATAYMAAQRETIDLSLTLSLAKVAENVERLPLKRYRDILENVVFLGMNAVKDETLARAAGANIERDDTIRQRALRRKYLKP